MTTGLIIGYGRAGQRHGKLLDELGIDWGYDDPQVSRLEMKNWKGAFGNLSNLTHIDFAVICTPPALHIKQIKLCLEAGLPVLCEKPLCSLGQLDEAKTIPLDSPVMVAYNYRHHPGLKPLQGDVPGLMICRQKRDDLPGWGLLEDHGSHDVDIVNWLTGGQLEIISARHNYKQDKEEWIIRGRVGAKKVTIKESIASYYNYRDAMLMYPNSEAVHITPDPQMYLNMWDAFLSGNYYPGLKEAIATQQLLEDCNAKSRMER